MKTPPMTVGDLRREIADLSDDWSLVFTLEGNPIAFNMAKVRGRKDINGENLIQIDFWPVKDDKKARSRKK
jgi:hypothetical protein